MLILPLMKICISHARLSAMTLALAAAFPVLAQTKDVTQLQETVVTATRNPQLLSSVLPHTTVITREDIERSQAVDLVTLLQREVGLQRIQNGGVGSTSTVFMRGSPSRQTLILIDGVPQNKQDASGSASLEHLMLESIDHVEIVRGNVSAIYGSGAIGGVIQIFTKTGARQPSVSLAIEYGPRNSQKHSGSVSAGLGDTFISVGLSRTTTDGFSSMNTDQQPTANPDSDGYRNTSANVSLTHRLSKDHSFGLKVMRTNSDTDFDNTGGAPTDIQTSTSRLSQTMLFTDNTWGNWRSRISLSEQSDKSFYHDETYASNDSYYTQATVLNWVNSLALGGDWLATAGLETQRQRVTTTTNSIYNTPYEKERDANAMFVGVEGKLGGGGLQLNLRKDKVGSLGETTGYFGYGYPLAEKFKLLASTSTAFNAPPLGYLYLPIYGNPLLLPERARSNELGLQFENGAHLLRATYFDTKIQDQLNFDSVANKFINIGRTQNSGVELSYKGSVGYTDIRASLTDQNPVDEITGQPLIRRAKSMFLLGVSHVVGSWRVGADLHLVGERPDAYFDSKTYETVKTTLDSYSVLDLTVSYKISSEVMLKGRLDNATDENYQTVYGYNQQPRSLYVGLSWTPKF